MAVVVRRRMWLIWALLGLTLVARPTWAEPLPDSTLLYVSDYVSFVGSDEHGHVAFALDNNRGRDGDEYQAEHFVVLHDEYEGWMDVVGSGTYPNSDRVLDRIPDSDSFQFFGTPRSGLTISSHRNRLSLSIDPIHVRTRRQHDGAETWMGSASAVLTYQDRTISGRVIYEYLVMPEFNRLTRTYWGLWKDFQGLYLTAGAIGDVYLHSQDSERLAALAGRLSGFSVLGEQTDVFRDLRVEVVARDLALGFYRWPTSWTITWTGSTGEADLRLTAFDRRKIGGWVIGGFAMAIVRGELSHEGRVIPVYGLAELLM